MWVQVSLSRQVPRNHHAFEGVRLGTLFKVLLACPSVWRLVQSLPKMCWSPFQLQLRKAPNKDVQPCMMLTHSVTWLCN